QQGSLAIARMAEGGDAARVDGGVGDQVINAALEAPGPSRDGPAIGRPVLGGVTPGQPGVNAVADVFAVRVDVAAPEGGEGVAALHYASEGPVCSLATTRGFGRGVVGASLAHVIKP